MNLLGGLRETGDLPLFSPKGRTYSPPRRHKLHILCPAASGRSHPFRCASFSHKVNDFVGALLRRWYALRHRALCEADAASVEASRQCHSTCGRCCHRLRDWANTVASTDAIFPTACANLPPAALPQRGLSRCVIALFSFAKEKQKKKE